MAGSANYEDLRNISTALFIVTLFVTLYRCYSRYRKKLWWHDDSAALFSTLFFVFFLVGSTYIAGGMALPLGYQIMGCYILIAGFYVPVWGARISIVLTVVRITPWRLQRKILLWVAVFFVLQFLVLILQAYWVCELSYTEWKQIPGSICVLPEVVPITQVVTTVISDSILIATPLMIAQGVHIRALRFRLFSIFSMSIATTLASLAHAILVMVRPGVWETIFGGVEVAVSIIVCNMSVIIPAILRGLGVGDPFMREDTVDPNISTGVEIARITSTGIELGLPISRNTVITDSDEYEGTIGMAVPRQRVSISLGVKDDRKHQLTMQVSDASLGNPKVAKVVPLADDECDITDSLSQVRKGSPGVKEDLGGETDVEDKSAKRNSS